MKFSAYCNNWFVAGVATLLLAGCASTPSSIDANVASKLKRIGVISMVGHEFNRHYTGLTAFGNEFEKNDIRHWKIDDEYEAQMQAVLSKLNGITGLRVPMAHEELAEINDPNGPWEAPGFTNPKWSAVDAKLVALAAKHSVDAFVIVTRRSTGDFLAGTNQHFKGAGFYTRGFGSKTSVSVMHLIAWVSVVEGSTGKPLAMKILARNHDTYAGASERTAPFDFVNPDVSRANFSNLSQAQKDVVKQQLIEIPQYAWEPTLRALLTPGHR